MSPPSNYCYASDGFKKVFSENSQDMDKIDYSFIPCSYINLYINNLNCQSVDDSLILFQRDEMNIHDDGTTPWYHIGCINWQSNGTSDFVMGWHFFRWEVIRSGVKEIYTDSFYVDEGDTVNYILNY